MEAYSLKNFSKKMDQLRVEWGRLKIKEFVLRFLWGRKNLLQSVSIQSVVIIVKQVHVVRRNITQLIFLQHFVRMKHPGIGYPMCDNLIDIIF